MDWLKTNYPTKFTAIIIGILAIGIDACTPGEKPSLDQSTSLDVVTEIDPTIAVDALQQLLSETPELLLLDVRTPEEVAEGKITENAIHINIHDTDFTQQVSNLDRHATYYVYCKAGGRSAKAQKEMQNLGFKQVINVEGGLTSWLNAGYPLVSKTP